ncbi:MAG: RecX family transcriptional regulator [Rhodocyclaceae bacterium]|nr:RecX family transcriptional regulator [Rhodocyclaceae bacterium]
MAASADDLRARALRLLARREYSRQELASRLLSKPAPKPARRNPRDTFAAESLVDEIYELPSASEVNALLDDLEQRKMLSDDRYAEMRARLRAPRYGDSRLRQELTQKGIDRDTIAAVLAEQPDELARCREIWFKKFGQIPRDMNERAKQTRHLASRGFAMRVIQQVIRGEAGDATVENILDGNDASCDNSVPTA